MPADATCDRVGDGDYSGEFYEFFRAVAEHLPLSFGPLAERRGRFALGRALWLLLKDDGKGRLHSHHVRREPDGRYTVIQRSPADPEMIRLIAAQTSSSRGSP